MSENFDIILDRSSLSLSDLVLHGDRQDGWCLMPGWQLPSNVPNTTYADSPYTDNATATHSTWQLGIISGDVVLSGAASPAARKAAITELRTALAQLSFPLSVDWGGTLDEHVTQGRGSMTPSPLTYTSVTRDEPVFSLSIQVEVLP